MSKQRHSGHVIQLPVGGRLVCKPRPRLLFEAQLIFEDLLYTHILCSVGVHKTTNTQWLIFLIFIFPIRCIYFAVLAWQRCFIASVFFSVSFQCKVAFRLLTTERIWIKWIEMQSITYKTIWIGLKLQWPLWKTAMTNIHYCKIMWR